MTEPALLDLNDTNLQLWHRGQAVQSPGYALLNGTQYTFGSRARHAARLRPRDINTRYWWHLNTEGLQPALGPARHTADLVHAHLLDIHQQAGEPSELILAVSGSMAREQLALLLGIVEQCPFNAVGLVNRSVALASAYPGPGKTYHLEIQLHQAVITELAAQDGQIEVRQTTALPGCGLLQLQEKLVEIIAAAFIRQTRFDPRRKAASEQQLYDALPAALRALGAAPETNIEVQGYRARINRAELRAAGELLVNSLPQAMAALHTQDRIILDPVAGLLPGLMAALPRGELLANDALSTAIEQHTDKLIQAQMGDQALNFVTALPCLTPPAQDRVVTAAPVATAPEPTPDNPSHLLQDAIAQPLQPDGTALGAGNELYRQDSQWLIRGAGSIQVNGENYVPGRALLCGERIQWHSGEVANSGLLILVQGA